MPRVKQMAIVCDDPARLEEYYCRWFGFGKLGGGSGGSVYLTDGYLNVGLLKRGPELPEENQEPGLHHVGIQVESIDEIKKRIREFDPSIQLEKRPEADPYSEYRIKFREPQGFAIDISAKGYGVEGEKRVPGIRHIATGDRDPESKLEFYGRVFDMREVEVGRGGVEAGKRSRGCVADGFVNICLVRRETDPREASHFGIIMRHPEDLVSKLREAYPTRPELWRPDRPGVEVHIRDAERNALSLSDKKGWEVDVGKWDRVEYEAQP
jgi:catechol 2,3-dioxygenase-like lactoylglutathione lyase family enzyme